MANFYFLELLSTKCFLGPEDKYSEWSALNKNCQKFDSKDDAKEKMVSLNETLDDVRIVCVSFPDKKTEKINNNINIIL